MLEVNKICTVLCAAFCGCGKTTVCNDNKKAIEFECWKYIEGDFPKNYIEDIKSKIGNADYIFISTNPVVLKELHRQGFKIKLVYPNTSLKDEYFERYINRASNNTFMKTLNKHWYIWINELKELEYCEQIELKRGQYLQDVL